VSSIAAGVLAPTVMLDIAGAPNPFLAPLPRACPRRTTAGRASQVTSRAPWGRAGAHARSARAAFDRGRGFLWRESRGIDATPTKSRSRRRGRRRRGRETNDRRALLARLSRLVIEVAQDSSGWTRNGSR
jgi:hypothetical protein